MSKRDLQLRRLRLTKDQRWASEGESNHAATKTNEPLRMPHCMSAAVLGFQVRLTCSAHEGVEDAAPVTVHKRRETLEGELSLSCGHDTGVNADSSLACLGAYRRRKLTHRLLSDQADRERTILLASP